MAYRSGNYSAFYVDEPFSEYNLGAASARDFVYYRDLCMWKGADSGFPFIDSHNKNYNVRDGSDWESTLKPRLRERLRNSKNIIFFLSSVTRNSIALREEIDYGINNQKLPVIVVYPDFSEKSEIVDSNGNYKKQIRDLWDNLPVFRDNKSSVAVLHVPCKKALIEASLKDSSFMVGTMTTPNDYYYSL